MDNLLKSLPREQNDPKLDELKAQLLERVNAQPFHRRPTFFAITIVGVTAVVIFSAAGTVLASQRATPGNFLYPIKRFTESVYLVSQLSPENKLRAERTILGRRVNEATRPNAKPTTPFIAAKQYRARAVEAAEVLEKAKGTDSDSVEDDYKKMDAFLQKNAATLDEQIPENTEALDEIDNAYIEAQLHMNEALLWAEEQRLGVGE